MTANELLRIFGIKNPTDKILKHSKFIQILNYYNNNDIDVYRHIFKIKEENLIILIENINSIETLFNILKRSNVLLNLDFYAYEIAKFYNLYNPDILVYSLDAKILIDSEYLKYATKEWTENVFVKQDKLLIVKKNGVLLKENDDIENIDSYFFNLRALKKAKKFGLLEKAILLLSNCDNS